MHEKTYVKWVCDFCGKEFDARFWCEQHEIEQHKCPNCKHSNYVKGSFQLNCELKNNNQKCNFEAKEK